MSSTINQITRKKGLGQWSQKADNKKKRKNKIKLNSSLGQPQATGICVRVVIKKPKKPNSASRKVAKIKLSSLVSPAAQRKGIFINAKRKKIIDAYIPGEGHNLKEHAMVKIRGGRVKDLPGVKYKCIRGVLDLAAVPQRKQARSKYGTPKLK